MPYYGLSAYLREKYGRRMKKICIDGGFSCPNRDGKCGTGGCIYCGERGAGEHINPKFNINEQVLSALECSDEDELFIAYFQNFTNTYAPVGTLRERYDAALIDDRIKILAVGTRPDCIDREIAELLRSYRDRVDVWVELGLQTASDKTAELINRGYKTEVFLEAARLLREYEIPFVVHVMIGLPEEGEREALETVELVNSVKPFGVKLHSTYVMKDTALATLLLGGKYKPLCREDYVRTAALAIASLSPEIVVHRITGDCPRDLLVAPEWNTDKNGVIRDIREYLREHGLKQGSLYKR